MEMIILLVLQFRRNIVAHHLRVNQLEDKMKTDRLFYKATALDESATTSAEQSINEGSRSSDNKDNGYESENQGNSKYKQYTNKSHKKKNILY